MIPRTGQDRSDAARYIGRLAGDLRRIASGADLDFLAYLLGMVEEEAVAEADGRRAPPPQAGQNAQISDTR